MTKRIFRAIGITALLVFLASFALIMGVLYNYFTSLQQKQLKTQIELAEQGIREQGLSYLEGLSGEDYRITWIAEDGSVLFDSRSLTEEMENHLEREEIREARETGYGESKRYSTTLMERSLYAAKRMADGTILRLSVAQGTVLLLLFGMAQPIGLIVLFAAILSLVIARQLAGKIVKPLNEIDLDHPLNNEGYDELAPLLRRIDSQQGQLKRQQRQLQNKQRELDTIVGSMDEGMILLTAKGQIVSINPAAERLLDTDGGCVGRDFLTVSRNPELYAAVEQAMTGKGAERTAVIHDRSYQLTADPVIAGDTVSGVAVLMVDVTERLQAEEMRKEFSANVSHELKTPLQSISGYSELLKYGMAKPEDVKPFAEKIYTEAQRLIHLVEDIISLSHLDEGAGDLQRETVDLYQLGEEVIALLQPAARSAGVEVTLTGEPAAIDGIRQLLQQIIYNLCDNAIKYNHTDGSVTVEISREEDAVVLSVTDTGIGIPKEDLGRIFERFYRVDKSRSKEVGGTGLGLSIVRHAARIHEARIQVDSTVGEGTRVAVRFPGDTARQLQAPEQTCSC